jgi:hypothetical protein
MAGLNNIPMEGGINSDKKIVQANPRGMPIRRAPKVTQKELTIIGNIPNKPLLGIHRSPSRKALGPIFKIKGMPSSKMKKVIKARIVMDERAIKRNIFSMIFSLTCMFIPEKSLGERVRALLLIAVSEPLGSRRIPKRIWLLLWVLL